MNDTFIKLRNFLKRCLKVLSDTWYSKPTSEVKRFDPTVNIPDKLLEKLLVGDRSYLDMEEYFKENCIEFDLSSIENSKVIKIKSSICLN